MDHHHCGSIADSVVERETDHRNVHRHWLGLLWLRLHDIHRACHPVPPVPLLQSQSSHSSKLCPSSLSLFQPWHSAHGPQGIGWAAGLLLADDTETFLLQLYTAAAHANTRGTWSDPPATPLGAATC